MLFFHEKRFSSILKITTLANKMKILVLSGTALDNFEKQVMERVLADPSFKIVAALIDDRPRPSFKKRFLKNLKRGRGGYMFIMFYKRLRAKTEHSTPSVDYFFSKGIPCLKTTQPYTSHTVELISPFGAEIAILLGGFGIIKEPLLSCAPGGILSYHHGDMRKYRGQPPAFWELYNNEKEVGVTLQKLSAGLDKGVPIVELSIPIEKQDTEVTLEKRVYDLSTEMMHTALQRMQDPNFTPPVIDYFGKIYTIPNLRQYLLLKTKLFLRKFSKS